jgi:D-glycero-alpha-D-manno-heptose-7-phosphate kinase
MIISRAPVRISMGGGGTDLPSYYQQFGGFLMAVTINKYVFIMANRRFSTSLRISYSQTEIVEHVSEIKHNIFREALKLLGIENQIELTSVADVPAHCGLGTSSTFTVALLNALFCYKKKYVSLGELAETACHIELGILHNPIGKQDQYAASFGGFNAYWFENDGTVKVEPVAINEGKLLELQNNILLFYLNMERQASQILQDQNDGSLKKESVVLDNLHRIKQMGLDTRRVFETGDLHQFGEILHEHWLAKKKLSSKISSSWIDEVYEAARKNGALGGKVVGAGGGGFLLLYCPYEKTKLIDAMSKFSLSPTWFAFEHDGAKIVYHH